MMKGFTNKRIVMRILCMLFLASILMWPDIAHAASVTIASGGTYSYIVSASGGTIVVTLTGASESVVCRGKPDWVSECKKIKTQFTVTVPKNTKANSQTGDITFTDGSKVWTLRIEQKAAVPTYTVSFNSNGGNPLSSTITVTYGQAYGSLPTPQRVGYSFSHWSTAGGTRIDSNTKVTITGNQTLYAQWNPNTYTVRFDSTGGSNVAAKLVTYDNGYGALPTPSKKGYTFSGWYLSASTGERIWDSTKMTIAGDHALYAHWSPKTITANFYDKPSGTVVWATRKYTVESAFGSFPSDPEPPTGYLFGGWYINDGKVTIGSVVPATDSTISLYPRWTPKTYVISFKNQDGTTSPSKTVTYDSKYGTLPMPMRTGYTFKGWYYNAAGTGNQVTASTKVTTTKNRTLYAQWEANTYTLTFYSQGTKVGTLKVTYDGIYGTTPEPGTRAGYKFAGWYTAENGGTRIKTGNTVKVTSNMKIYAQWKGRPYTVSFDSRGGSMQEPITINYSEPYGALPTPTRTGFTFKDWYLDISDTTTRVRANTIVTTIGNHTLYAKWKANTYTIKFNSRGGTPADSIVVTYSKKYGTLPKPTRDGCTFVGWFTEKSGGEEITAEKTVKTAADQVLYARWKGNLYTVSFDSRTGSAVADKQVRFDKTYGKLDIPTRDGYEFLGWFTAAKGGTKIEENTTVEITANQTLYAHWKAKTYTISFDSTGGNLVSQKEVTYKKKYGELVAPTRKGYTFDGWYTAANKGKLIDANSDVKTAGDHTLYAHWIPKEYTLSFNSCGGTAVGNIVVTYDSLYGDLPVPTRDGYDFLGWFTAESGGRCVLSTAKVSITSNKKLYAHWEKTKRTLEFRYFTDTVVKTITIEDGTVMELPDPYYYLPGTTFYGWYIDKQPDSPAFYNAGDSYTVTRDQVFYAWVEPGDSGQTGKHDFSCYKVDKQLKNVDFVFAMENADAGSYGFSQYYFSHYYDCGKFQWKLYDEKNGKGNTESWLADSIQTDEELQSFLRQNLIPGDYSKLVCLMKEKYPEYIDEGIGTRCYPLSPNAFSVIDTAFNGQTYVSDTIRKYYGLEMQEFFEGSCGIFAAVNTYLYLKGAENNKYKYSIKEVEDTICTYIESTDGVFDWLERNVSKGDGIASISNFLQNGLKERSCNAIWQPFENVSYEKINNLLEQDIPVIMSYYRADGAEIKYYYKTIENVDGKVIDVLKQSESCNSHYFVVTGTYYNPAEPNKHFLEVSTWGTKRYICLEEYLYGSGLNLWSNYMEIKLD